MFQILPQVERLSPNRYRMLATVLTPDSGYRARRASLGLPPGQNVVPEAVPVILELDRITTGTIQSVESRQNFRLADFRPRRGKERVVIFAVCQGQVVARATAELARPAAMSVMVAAGDANVALDSGRIAFGTVVRASSDGLLVRGFSDLSTGVCGREDLRLLPNAPFRDSGERCPEGGAIHVISLTD
jgi:hypothetical protein